MDGVQNVTTKKITAYTTYREKNSMRFVLCPPGNQKKSLKKRKGKKNKESSVLVDRV